MNEVIPILELVQIKHPICEGCYYENAACESISPRDANGHGCCDLINGSFSIWKEVTK